MSTTAAKMDYTLASFTLYPIKCIIGTSVESLDRIKITDPSTGKEDDNKHPHKVCVDSNFCGEVRFVTVRPIILDNTKLHDNPKLYAKYMPADLTTTGLGRFTFNFSVNPYGFKPYTKMVQAGNEYIERSTGVVASTAGVQPF